jgi:A/G-specific adenine glycosylase
MPWRIPALRLEGDELDPYPILVSELMLQQTQVARVIPKYEMFMKLFPTVGALADAPLADVLSAWTGLGYNRRAKFLHQAARMVRDEFGGTFPKAAAELVRLPGVGPNTAGAIAAYAYDAPSLYLETNIRTVLIHHFFQDRGDVTDAELMPYLRASLPDENYREWYWALMDYGSYLKATVGNLSRRSRGYVRQSTFHGSQRQVRGAVLKTLVAGASDLAALTENLPDERLPEVLADLVREGLVEEFAGRYQLPGPS